MTLRPIDLRLLDNPLEVRVEPGPRSWWFIGAMWTGGLLFCAWLWG